MKNNLMFGLLVNDMKLEAMSTDHPLATHDFRNHPGAEKYSKPTRVCLPSLSLRIGATASRESLRALRAAEMEAWTLTGGDYLRSLRTRLHDNHNVVFLQSPPDTLDYGEETI